MSPSSTPKPFFEEDVDDGGEAIGGAGGVGDDVMLGGIVFVLVDAHDHGQAIALGGGADDDLFGAGGEMTFGFLDVGEQAGGFDDEVDAHLFPGELRGVFGADDLDIGAVDDQHIVFGFVGAGFLGADGALEPALGGIVFEQVTEVIGGNNIAHGDHLDVLAHEPLFHHRAEDQAPDPAEPVNCNFHCHINCPLLVRFLYYERKAHVNDAHRTVKGFSRVFAQNRWDGFAPDVL
jgi:hypothetical protein